jgi:class 3 adenylate cyclase
MGDMRTSVEPLAFVVSLAADRAGMQFPIIGPSFSIGRDPSNNLCVMDDPAISRQHCLIHVVGSSLMIEDCESRNGTFQEGKRVEGIAPLGIPSTVLVGHTALAIVPNRPNEQNVTSIIDTSATGESDIIVIPQTGMLRMRTDAFLVVDLVNSTELVQRDSHYFAKLTLAMGRTLDRFQRDELQSFLKCTGDGFFACFGTASAALRAGVGLVPALARQMELNAQISVALHWGPSNLTDTDDRIGNNVHAVFSVEQVRHQDRALGLELRNEKTMELLLMTEAFWAELQPAEQAMARPLGSYPLKGMDEDTRIYRWYGPGPQHNDTTQPPA